MTTPLKVSTWNRKRPTSGSLTSAVITRAVMVPSPVPSRIERLQATVEATAMPTTMNQAASRLPLPPTRRRFAIRGELAPQPDLRRVGPRGTETGRRDA